MSGTEPCVDPSDRDHIAKTEAAVRTMELLLWEWSDGALWKQTAKAREADERSSAAVMAMHRLGHQYVLHNDPSRTGWYRVDFGPWDRAEDTRRIRYESAIVTATQNLLARIGEMSLATGCVTLGDDPARVIQEAIGAAVDACLNPSAT